MSKLHITDPFRWIPSQRASNAKSFSVTWRHHVKLSLHYNDVTMGRIACQITSLTIAHSTAHPDEDQRKHQKLRVTGFCAGNSPGTGEFPGQMASNAECFHLMTSSCLLRLNKQGPESIWRWWFTSIGKPNLEIKRSYDRLVSTMGFPILVRWRLYIESAPSAND